MDFEVMYRAMDSRDRRFDGRFFVAVTSTGIYCRPICPAPTPQRKNTRFYRYAAVAELAGFRPCRRCRPEVSPDTAEWDTRADLVGRGLRLIAQGLVDERGVRELAARLGVSERHLQRVFKAEVGATPGVIARSRRARLARQLLAETALPITQVAYNAGFNSVRAFNETVRQIYQVTPSDLRRGRPSGNGALRLELPYRPPLTLDALFGYLRQRATPGVEEVSERSYSRAVRHGSRGAVITLQPSTDAFTLTIEARDAQPLAPVVQQARRLLDLDADPDVIDDWLRQSPILAPLIEKRPGLRLPGSYDPFHSAVQAILQQGSTPQTAASLAGRIAAEYGAPVSSPVTSITHMFPRPHDLVGADLIRLGVAPRKDRAIKAVATALEDGHLLLDGSAHPDNAAARLRALPGIGNQTISVLAMHTLRDPDAFPAKEAAIRNTLSARAADSRAIARWRPWRAYAAMHLWADGPRPVA